jgi:hypothetical protein
MHISTQVNLTPYGRGGRVTDLSTSSGGEGYGENLVGTSFVVAFLC